MTDFQEYVLAHPETYQTSEYKRRTVQAIEETQRLFDRAMSYSPKFRDQKQIAGYEAHLVNLHRMLAGE